MSRPRLLDLCCGPGGAARGYADAGFEIVGVDINPQPHYPFEFHQADALSVLRSMLYWPTFSGELWRPGYFDAIHASFPCQTFARVTAWRGDRDDHPNLITPGLPLLDALGLPYVVENVPEAPLRADVTLCGSQFGLRIKRHRIFQLNWRLDAMLAPCHHRGLLPFMHKGERAYADAMGCTWMDKTAARQAIPPAYCEFIGTHLLAWLRDGDGRFDDSSPERIPGTSASLGHRTDSHRSTDDPAGNASSGCSLPAGSAVIAECSAASSTGRGGRD